VTGVVDVVDGIGITTTVTVTTGVTANVVGGVAVVAETKHVQSRFCCG
jgi:hypothetical protein